MGGWRSILYVFDGEPEAVRAFRRAADLAVKTGATLTVAHCLPAEEIESDSSRWEARLAELAQGCGVDTPVLRLLFGEPADIILEEVASAGHDLVMKTAGDDTGGMAILLGSLDGRLMRECPVPLLIDRPRDRNSLGPVLAAIDAADPDDRELSVRILEVAAEVAACEDSVLHVLHAWRVHGELGMRGRAFSVAAEDAVDEELDKERAEHAAAFEALLAPLRAEGVRLEAHLVKGRAEHVIPDAVRRLGIDLVVMGTVARRGLRGMLMGNTAESVLGTVECGVMAVKPPGFDPRA